MTAPLPASLSRAEAEGDIDARILRVEQRLIAREETLRRGVASLGCGLRARFRPGRLLLPVAGGLLAVAALAALRRPAAARPASPRRSKLPWLRLLGLAWPLLPARWRERVGPAAGSSFVTLVLSLVEALLGGGRGAPPPAPAAEVDLAARRPR